MKAMTIGNYVYCFSSSDIGFFSFGQRGTKCGVTNVFLHYIDSSGISLPVFFQAFLYFSNEYFDEAHLLTADRILFERSVVS